MALTLPQNFRNDIQGRNTNLIPLVVIGNYDYDAIDLPAGSGMMYPLSPFYAISTNSFYSPPFLHTPFNSPYGEVGAFHAKPLLINIPSLKESVDIEKRNYKISSVNLDISNYEYEGERFSELVGNSSLINMECRIWWISPSSKPNYNSYTAHSTGYPALGIADQNWAVGDDVPHSYFQVFFGTIRRYTHDDEKVRLVVEDRSQAALHKDLPIPNEYDSSGNIVGVKRWLGTGEDVPDKYKNKPIPMVYGGVDRSPLVISENFRKYQADSQAVDFIDNDSDYTDASDNAISLDSLAIDIDGEFYQVVEDGQYKIFDNYISLESNILNNIIAGAEDTVDTLKDISLICRKIARPKFSITNPREDSELINEDFLDGYSVDSINAITDGSLDVNNIGLLGQRNVEDIGVTAPDTASDHERLLLSMNMDVTPEHDTVGGVNKIIGFQINGYNLPKFLGDKVLKANHKNGLVGSSGDITSISSTYDVDYHIIWRDDCLHADIIQKVFGFTGGILYQAGSNYLAAPNSYDATLADIQIDFSDIGNPNSGGFDMPIILFSGGVTNTFNIQFRALGDHTIPVGDSFSYFRANLTGHIDEIGLLVENEALKVFSKNFYANVNGRAIISGTSPTAPTIISHLVTNELNIDQPSWDTGQYIDWQHAFTVDKKINSKKLIEGIASTSPYIPRFNNMGEFKFNVIKKDYNSSDHDPIPESDVIDFSFKRTPIEDVVTKIEFKYNWDYARSEFSSRRTLDITNWACFDANGEYESFSYYGLPDDHIESTLVIDDDRGKYIRDDDTAGRFVCWMMSWFCNQHLVIKVKLPLKWMNVEIGDIVEFKELLSGIAPYGIDYTKNANTSLIFQEFFKYFMVTETNKRLDSVEISCMQMHKIWDDVPNSVDLDGNMTYD